MTKPEFFRHLEDLLERPANSVTDTSNLADIGWDSMSVVGFIAFVDSSFGTTVLPSKLQNCKTISDLIALLDGKVA